MGFIDELWSGVAVVGAPAVERELELDHAAYTSFVFALPLVLGAVLETGLLLAMDRAPRRFFLWGGLAALMSALAACALAPGAWWLSLGLASAGAASGAAGVAAQAELIERTGDAERALVRWTLFANLGDLLVPVVVAGALIVRGSYRDALWVVIAIVGLQLGASIVSLRSSAPVRDPAVARRDDGARDEERDEDAREPLLASLRDALRRADLLVCLLGAAMCSLLDEIAAALAALRARADLGASEATSSAALFAFSLGAIAGTVVTDRALGRVSGSRVLVASAALSCAGLAMVVAADTPLTLALALSLVGFAAAAHHPILHAWAYSCAPGRPGLVNAVGQLFVLVELGAPLALGWVATRGGLDVALACLALQPAAVVLIAWWRRSRA